jgi:hypothetical protein
LIATKILASLMLLLGIGSMGIIGYLFFVVMPPILLTVDQTAEYLTSFELPDVSLQDSAEKIRNTAQSIPSCPEEQFGGCVVLDLRETKAELNDLADSIEGMKTDIEADTASLEKQVNQAGSQLAYLRPMMLAVGGWMFAVSTILTLSGVVFLLIDRELVKRAHNLQHPEKRDPIASSA